MGYRDEIKKLIALLLHERSPQYEDVLRLVHITSAIAKSYLKNYYPSFLRLCEQNGLSEDGGLTVRPREYLQIEDDLVSVMYTLNENFQVLEVRGVAKYQRIYSDQYNDGELEKSLSDEFWESLKDSVLYWDESTESFVSQSEKEE